MKINHYFLFLLSAIPLLLSTIPVYAYITRMDCSKRYTYIDSAELAKLRCNEFADAVYLADINGINFLASKPNSSFDLNKMKQAAEAKKNNLIGNCLTDYNNTMKAVPYCIEYDEHGNSYYSHPNPV